MPRKNSGSEGVDIRSQLQSKIWIGLLAYILIYPLLPIFGSEKLDQIVNLAFLVLGPVYLFTLWKEIKENLLDLAVILFFLSIFIPLFFLPGFIYNLGKNYKFFLAPILFYLAKNSLANKRRWLINVLIISGCLVSLYSLRAFFIVAKYLPAYLAKQAIEYPFAHEFLARQRTFAPFFSPNLLAGYLAMTIFITTGMLLGKKEKNKWGIKEAVSFIGIIISLLAFFLTKSIGGWLSFLFSLLLVLLLGKKINQKAVFAILVIFLFLSLVFVLRTKAEEKTAKPLFSLSQRTAYWRDTLKIIKQHPFIGTGLGNFSLRESRYAHNSYLQIWAEMGVVGFINWLAIIFMFMKKSIETLKSSKTNIASTAFFAAGLSFLIHNLVDFSFFVPQVAYLWWIILGLKSQKLYRYSS